jgi:hypothetical protein
MLAVADVVTLAPVFAFNAVVGDHVYDDAPLTLSVVLEPEQSVALLLPVSTGVVFTTMFWDALWPVTVYVMLCVPAPAVEGLNTPPLTPGPLYVPPVGAPPVNVNDDALAHTALNGWSVMFEPPPMETVHVVL